MVLTKITAIKFFFSFYFLRLKILNNPHESTYFTCEQMSNTTIAPFYLTSVVNVSAAPQALTENKLLLSEYQIQAVPKLSKVVYLNILRSNSKHFVYQEHFFPSVHSIDGTTCHVSVIKVIYSSSTC